MRPGARREAERGSAVVEFVLITLVLVPLVLGIAQVALVLHVRNTLTAAASEGARTSAVLGATPEIGEQRARALINDTLADGFAQGVTARRTESGGVPISEVTVRASVPALGLFGPSVDLAVTGHAVLEVEP